MAGRGPPRDAPAVDDLLRASTMSRSTCATPTRSPRRSSRYADRPSVSYLATPPDLFVPVRAGPASAAGLLDAPSRLVLEKPIGHDLASAREINAALRACLDESRIFRIDHYLGKARGAEPAGAALRQHAARSGVAPPLDRIGRHPGRRDRRRRRPRGLLRGLRRAARHGAEPHAAAAGADRDGAAARARRRQHARRETQSAARAAADDAQPTSPATPCAVATAHGVVEGRAVQGLRRTTAHGRNLRRAARLRSTTGAGPACRSAWSPASAWPRAPPRSWCRSSRCRIGCSSGPRRGRATPNRLRMRLQPEENIELGLMGSLAAPEWGALRAAAAVAGPVDVAVAAAPHRLRTPAASMRCDGNQTLFVRDDEVEAAWHWIDSISAPGAAAAQPVLDYPAGSWGPAAAADFLPATLRQRPRRRSDEYPSHRNAAGRYRRHQRALRPGRRRRTHAAARGQRAGVRRSPTSRRWPTPRATISTAPARRRSEAVFAVAGRVDGDEARITNHPWVISATRTRQRSGLERLQLVNDFAAQAMAVLAAARAGRDRDRRQRLARRRRRRRPHLRDHRPRHRARRRRPDRAATAATTRWRPKAATSASRRARRRKSKSCSACRANSAACPTSAWSAAAAWSICIAP